MTARCSVFSISNPYLATQTNWLKLYEKIMKLNLKYAPQTTLDMSNTKERRDNVEMKDVNLRPGNKVAIP